MHMLRLTMANLRMRSATHANLELTRLCNQRCVYCFNDSGPEKANAGESIDWSSTIDTLSRKGFRSVHFTGGEPFVVGNVLGLMRTALNRGLRISVLSNGHNVPQLLETPEGKDVLVQMQAAQISLDSMVRELHDRRRGKAGAWARAVAAIRSLKSARIPTEISCVVDEENEGGVAAVAAYAHSQEARLILRPRVRSGRAADKQRYTIGERLRAALLQFRHVLTDDRFHYVPGEMGVDGPPRGVVTVTADGEIRGDLSLLPACRKFGRDGILVTA